MKLFLRYFFLVILLLPQLASALVGSKRAGKGWEAIVYIEFYFSNEFKTSCSGFLINDSQVVTVGHCAIHDESSKKANSASICIGIQKPFTNPGEGCFQSSTIRFAKNYQYNTPSDMVIINLAESIPLNFLGIKPIRLLPGKHALKYYNNQQYLNASNTRIVSFGSRNFNTPTTGKKGWVGVNKLAWNEVLGIWQAMTKGAVYGQSDDGAGLLIKTQSGWMLAGLLLDSKPDFFVSVQPLFDPCLPPEPAPRQPDIKITSTFNFVSINTLACHNRFFSKHINNQSFCKLRPVSTSALRKKAQNLDKGGNYAFQLYNSSERLSEQLKWLNKAASRGHPMAMLLLSEHYKNGNGLRQNSTKAIKLLESAARKSLAEAEYRIGMILKEKFKKNNTTVKGKWYQWINKAAEQGHAAAQYQYSVHLASMNSSQVYNWLMRSARQGYAPAQYQLGYNFYTGKGVKKDSYQGQQWIEYAAGQGNLLAVDFLTRHPQQPDTEF